MIKHFDKLVIPLVAVAVFVATGCWREVAESAVDSMPPPAPDPVTGEGGITSTQFWLTWGATFLAHEGRKLVRRLFNGKDKPES